MWWFYFYIYIYFLFGLSYLEVPLYKNTFKCNLLPWVKFISSSAEMLYKCGALTVVFEQLSESSEKVAKYKSREAFRLVFLNFIFSNCSVDCGFNYIWRKSSKHSVFFFKLYISKHKSAKVHLHTNISIMHWLTILFIIQKPLQVSQTCWSKTEVRATQVLILILLYSALVFTYVNCIWDFWKASWVKSARILSYTHASLTKS